MKLLRIFFPTEKLRDHYLEEWLQGNRVNRRLRKSQPYDKEIQILFTNKYRGIPGYWAEIYLLNHQKGIEEKIIRKIPDVWFEANLFYPNEKMKIKKMEDAWEKKYLLNREKNNTGLWNAFYKELRTHFYEERVDIASIGLLYIYKKNPFFLKKYKRFYIFEDMAYYYESIGQLHKSIKFLKIQASLQPDSTEPYLNMSSFLIFNGMNTEAVGICKKGLEIRSDDEYLCNNLLVAYLNSGQLETAMEYLSELIARYPDSSAYWKLMGDVFYELNDETSAVGCYKEALSNCSFDMEDLRMDIFYSIGSCYQSLNMPRKAIRYYKKVLHDKEKEPSVLLNLSKLYGEDLKKYDKAQGFAEKMVKYYPENGYGHHNLGLVYLYTGKYDKARWHLYKARKLLPEYYPVQDAILELKRLKKDMLK
ncbi:MAG: tetratricopeptide repeat protein [Bacillota bacterium]